MHLHTVKFVGNRYYVYVLIDTQNYYAGQFGQTKIHIEMSMNLNMVLRTPL